MVMKASLSLSSTDAVNYKLVDLICSSGGLEVQKHDAGICSVTGEGLL